MFLIVGLGNPGKEYEKTRHNVGREIVLALRGKIDFPEFRFEKKWNAGVSEGKIGKEKVVLLLPDTLMNKSGLSVAPALRFYKAKPKDLFAVHDDADLTLGSAKMSFGKHSAGHKGVESVIKAIKTLEFWRFRVGIGGKRDVPAEKLVLKRFTPEEAKIAKKIMAKTADAVLRTIEKGAERARNEFNGK